MVASSGSATWEDPLPPKGATRKITRSRLWPWGAYHAAITKYVEAGIDELDQDNLPVLLENKYQSLPDAGAAPGDLMLVKDLFVEFQKYLYEERVA